MKSTNGQKILIAFFLVIILAPNVFWLFFKDYFDTANYENRSKLEKPSIELAHLPDFPEQYEDYYNDSLPFRNQLIKLNSKIEYYIFKNSSHEDVIVGKNGWLFYNKKADGDPVATYKGLVLFTEEELEQIAGNLEKSEKKLADMGCEFVLYIAPNKERVYYEEMPDYYGMPAEYYKVGQLVEYLEEHTDIRIVYPYHELMEAKSNFSDLDLYHRVDTHWNSAGGYIGGTVLLHELGIDMPAIGDDSLSIQPVSNQFADLANYLNLGSELNTEKDYSITGYESHNPVTVKDEFFGEWSFKCDATADSRKLLMARDSFCTAMITVIASQFRESCMIHHDGFSDDMIEKYEPDIFVYELVERNIPLLSAFCFE